MDAYADNQHEFPCFKGKWERRRRKNCWTGTAERRHRRARPSFQKSSLDLENALAPETPEQKTREGNEQTNERTGGSPRRKYRAGEPRVWMAVCGRRGPSFLSPFRSTPRAHCGRWAWAGVRDACDATFMQNRLTAKRFVITSVTKDHKT